jgi:chemotaxis protein MotB
MPAAPEPVIIIKKKMGGHAAHHGGAWKVAYADFVTAMMSLFIVLWLMSANSDVQKAVAGYFRDPKGYGKTGSSVGGAGESLAISKSQMGELKEKLEGAMRQMPEFQKLKNNVTMTVTGEGLRIELLETEKGMFFDSGNAQPSAYGKDLLESLSKELGKLQNSVLIEGHTDSRPFNSTTYSNWELSSDRANSARRIMQESGLGRSQVSQVRGFADQKLRDPSQPDDASNRRISVIVQYAVPPPSETPPPSAGQKPPPAKPKP